MVLSSAPAQRRAVRVGSAVVGVGILSVALSGCIISLPTAVDLATDQTVTCTEWTITVNGLTEPATIGANYGTGYQGRVIDGDGTVLFQSDRFESITYAPGTTVQDYPVAADRNPIVAGIYTYVNATGRYDPDEKFRAEYLGGCAELPLHATAARAPGSAANAASLPSFDVRFSEPVSGFTGGDLVLGGTADPTGYTLTPLSETQKYDDYDATDDVSLTLLAQSQIYRVTITEVEQDGTVTLSVPAGAVAGHYSDVNVATGTAEATVDRTPPAADPLEDIALTLPAGETATTASWSWETTDPSGVAASACTPASGSAFPLGDTIVTCTAEDTLGNTSTTDFTVGIRTTPVVQITAQGTDAVDQGDTAVFTVTGTDDLGESGPLPASDFTVTSSVATDVIETADGEVSVTFPHASPHTLTLTQTSTGATAELLVEVTPTEVTPGEEPSGEQTPGPGAPVSGGAEAPTASALANTGADPTPLIITAGALIVLGAAVLVIRAIRRRRDDGDD